MKLKSLILNVFRGRVRLPRLTSLFDKVFGAKGQHFRQKLSKSWHRHGHRRRVSYLSLALLFSFSLLSESFLLFGNAGALNRITPEINQLLVDPIPSYGGFIEYESHTESFVYNKGYQASGSIFGTKGSPKFSASFPLDGSAERSIIDPSTGTAIKITPNYDVGNGQRDQNRLVYPVLGRDAVKVISFGGIGYKEDIVLNSYQGSTLQFSYELEVPSGVEARLESDGSVGFYGVREELLGNVSTGSEEDAALLESARQNGTKTNLLFRIPAPYVIESGRRDSIVDTFYTLEGNTLTTVATNLRQANYPLTIDPSVYVETARKFMRGNNETNIDFDVDNELIQKGSTTGARFDNWTSAMALNAGLTDGGSVVAGGYMYYLGGVGSAGSATSTEYATAGSYTYDVPVGVTQVIVEMWGAGGGGGGSGVAGSDGDGGAGGGGAYATGIFTVVDTNDIDVIVGGAGGAGDFSTGTDGEQSGDGGGGGGHSEVTYQSTLQILAAGGGGGGGGDNSSAVDGGAGAPGGDDSDGFDGGASGNAGGGGGASTSPDTGGAAGTGGENSGTAGTSEQGGDGADGTDGNPSTDGSKNNGGSNGGGDGGNGDVEEFYGAGGGGGGGYYGGGGGSSSDGGDAGGGGGGSGTSYLEAGVTGGSAQSGSGSTPGNNGDSDRGTAGEGGAGGVAGSGDGSAGTAGKVIITPYYGNEAKAELYWANINDSSGALTSPNPGDGACTDWCTNSAYDLPEERQAFSLVAYNGFLYAIGGEDDSNNIEATVFIAKLGANGEPALWHPSDPDKDNWVYWYEDTSAPLTTATKYGAAVAYNNRLYFLGGETSGSPGGVTTVEYTDLNPTGTLSGWTTTGTVALSTARFMHSVEVYNGYLYVVGGDSSSSGALLNTVEYMKLAADGTFSGSWESTSSFSGARRSDGGKFTTIYGAYLYLTGGCTSVSSGNCQTVGDEIQIASIFADGSLGDWSTDSNETNQRVGYGLHAWQGNVYRIGGCTSLDASGDCSAALAANDYGVINPPGEVSTVNISETSGTGNCSGSTPFNCDLPPLGDDAGEGGQLLSMAVVLNGYLYNIGGCIDYTCDGTTPQPNDVSGNVSYVAIAPDGSLERPDDCVANGNTLADNGGGDGAWCVDSTRRVNGTDGVAAAGVTTFNGRIYIVGGIEDNGSGDGDYSTNIYYNSTEDDGSLSGTWSSSDTTTAGATDVAYTYTFTRANPNGVPTVPGNLYILGGCDGLGTPPSCDSYSTEVFKCNIAGSGAVSGCTTSNQLQIDSTPGTGGSNGLGIHSGTVYANYIYLIGGYSAAEADKDDVLYARIDDSNNIVAVSGSDWIESPNKLSIGRRRGWAFGYNGHVYSVGGYDTGEGTIPFIEWSKLNVSDGSIDEFVTSNITINQRWGLTMAVSNSFAYVIGGCDVGPSPSPCSSFEESVQTFQLYNNDSGAQANYTESTGNFATDNNRIGSSAAVLNGYIYVAGGENGGTIDSDSASVQYAPLNPNGTIGTWLDTTETNFPARAFGQLEAVGGSLYYVGGEDNAGDEKSDVYYATPTTGSGTNDVIRTTTYKIAAGQFTGTSYTLTLQEDLENDYFAIVAGSSSETSTNRGPDMSQVRVDGDPFGNLTATTASNAIRLERGNSTNDWVGTVTVVECVSACTTDGFELDEVINGESGGDGNLAANNTQTDYTLAAAHTTNTVPFGGYLGGGLSTAEAGSANFSATAGVRIKKNSTNQIRVERQDDGVAANAGNAAAADITIYVVDWGSNWNIEEVDFDNWDAGGQGVDVAAEYTTQTITSVTRANTWVWKSPGHSDDNGLGDGAFGKVVTLGDGENENATETTVALGSEPTGDNRDDTVYVMEHTDLSVDYEFKTRANDGASFTDTVATAIEPETVTTCGSNTCSEGYRIPLYYYTDNGTGTAYTRTAGWSHYHSNSTTISFAKSRTGNNQAGWVQSVDFGNNAGTSGGGDITTWGTATNGLPGDRTRHGAAVWNDRIYVVAGLDDSANETNTVYVSPKLSSGGDITSAWATNGDEPDVERSGAAVIAYANNIYLLGGNDGTNYFSDVQFASIGYKEGTISQSGTTVTGTGTSWTAGQVGSELQYADGSTATISSINVGAQTMVVSASKTVASGSRYLIDDGSVGEWTFTTSLPQYVSDADGFASNGFMYLFGGRSAASTCTNNSYVAPISANTTIASGNNPTGIGEWYQTNVEYTGDRYSAGVAYNEGKVYITGGGCGTELTSNQHYYGTLRSQPQVARYSYFIDADTDVFPNSWLLNGLDNNIGARWQFGYRSSTDSANAWGQDTDTGDVTLGQVGTYTPVDGVGANTDFARYFYVTISIDASQTFGYPDDVTRGPTIDDFTLFFTADPNKRLRHGKTFIQGVEQPLDTPCRVSGANPAGSQPNCPLP